MRTAAVLLALALLLGAAPSRTRKPTPASARRVQIRRPRGRDADAFATASALDILAVCLQSGMAVPTAAAATAPSAPPEFQAMLQRAADLLALGADPETAWSIGDGTDEGLVALARLARRSASSGSALAQGISELADQSRQNAIYSAASAAERAGVLIAGPLGLCFLPAFICLGIVPVVAGLAGDVFSTGLL